MTAPSQSSPTDRVVRRRWNRPQSKFLKIRAVPSGPVQYVDLEGAVGSGKTTAPSWKLIEYITLWPGIHFGLLAWTDDMLGPPKAAFLEAARDNGLDPERDFVWRGGQGEDFYEFPAFGNARVYIRSMRASEDSMRTQKLAGLNLSVIWIDQPEPVEQDVFEAYVPARLRQPGFPHEVWLTPNPLSEGHWLSLRFPADPKKAKPNHHYIRSSIHDNVEHVGAQFIADMEAAHPPGTPTRARMVDGTRAPILKGKPIYGPKLFKPKKDGRAWHVRTVDALTDHPIHDAWDFGQLHPACVFSQLTWWGQLRILGAIEGDDIFLEYFAPLVREQRAEWFGDKATYETTCDPAGTTGNAHGTILNGTKILESHDIHPITSFNLNRIEGISYAIETIGGFMSREVVQPISKWCGCEYCQHHQPGSREGDRLRHELVVRDGKILHGVRVPALVVDSRRHLKLSNTDSVDWPVLINGFTSGYVHDKRAPQGESNLKRPLKDGEHDHTQRCLEYTVQQFWKTRPAGEQLEADIIRFHEARARAEERAERRAREKDTVEIEHQRVMRDLRLAQPAREALRPRTGFGAAFQVGGPRQTHRRGGY